MGDRKKFRHWQQLRHARRERAEALARGNTHLEKPIAQFAPSADRMSYPGVFGWGFDSNGFRIVMYGPVEEDHIVIHRPETGRTPMQEDETADEGTKAERREEQRAKRRIRTAQECQRNAEFHGPAHVHVFDRHTGYETRFKLIEPADGYHRVEPLYTSQRQRTNSLTPEQIHEVTPILEANAARFIQLWREMYRNDKLGGYVARIARYGKKEVEQILDKNGNIVCRDANGYIALIPPEGRGR